MKKIQILIILLLFGFINLSAQNWQPIYSNTNYNYQIDTADCITSTVKVDSVNIIEGDSVFFLNRIITNCDTCSDNDFDYYALKNQPQFLMRKMIKISDSLFIFQDTSEFRIMPLFHFGQSWVYDAENNINAVISYEGEGIILNQNDSVKQISLSNGNSLIISKNFGIIQFPFDLNTFYNLVGFEKNNNIIGEKLPDFWDIFNWEVGDIFQRMQYSEGWGDWYIGSFDIKKYSINSKQIMNDTIVYEVEGWNKHIFIEDDGWQTFIYDTTAFQFSEILVIVDSVSHFANKTNHELSDIIQFQNLTFWDAPLIDKVHLYYKQGRYVKQCGTIDYYPYPFYQVSDIHPDLLENCGGPDQVIYKYTEGLGLDYEMRFFEIAEGDIFMGKIHDGDTIGIVYPDSHFEQYVIDIEELGSENILIYPNPVYKGQIIQIKTKKEIDRYNIYNISGIKIISNKYFGAINLSSLSSGIYILELFTNDKIIREKIIIK